MIKPTYKITVTYAAGHDQEHPALTETTAQPGVEAFLRDLFYLKGEGVQRVSVEIEGERDEHGAYLGERNSQ